jgi:phenol hydroxylase P3 protein
MMDYMLPKRVMSWKEAWEIYFEQGGGALFEDLGRYGLRMPKYAELALEGKQHVTHQLWAAFYNYTAATAFHTWMPDDEELDWLSAKYPDTFDDYYRPRFEYWREQAEAGNRFYNPTLPMLCQTCQIPMGFTEPGDPTTICFRQSDYDGNRYHFCSDGCKDIFDNEPEKYCQAWMPTHQVYQGNCGGATMPEVLAWYHLNVGEDNLDYADSPDRQRWEQWKGIESPADGADSEGEAVA